MRLISDIGRSTTILPHFAHSIQYCLGKSMQVTQNNNISNIDVEGYTICNLMFADDIMFIIFNDRINSRITTAYRTHYITDKRHTIWK